MQRRARCLRLPRACRARIAARDGDAAAHDGVDGLHCGSCGRRVPAERSLSPRLQFAAAARCCSMLRHTSRRCALCALRLLPVSGHRSLQ
jgi:hypothetical protein